MTDFGTQPTHHCTIRRGPDEGTYIVTDIRTGAFRVAWTSEDVLSLAHAAGWQDERTSEAGTDRSVDADVLEARRFLDATPIADVRSEWCRAMA